MKIISRLYSIPVFAVLLLTACDKNKQYSPDTPFVSYTSMHDFFETEEVKFKTMTLNPDVTNSFYGNSGTQYVLYANSLQKADGSAVTGEVQVQVREWLNKGDMIFSRMLPMSNDRPLISGGEFEINVTQGGERLYLKPGSTVKATVPQGGAAEKDMFVFRGDAALERPMSLVEWRILETNGQGVNSVYSPAWDSLSVVTDSLSWINIDKFPNPTSYTSFDVNLSVQGVTANGSDYILSYVIFDEMNSVMSVATPVNGIVKCKNIPDVPMHFASLVIADGKLYGGVMPVSAGSSNMKLVLTQKNATDFKKEINGLQ